jgi:hypothetical protein
MTSTTIPRRIVSLGGTIAMVAGMIVAVTLSTPSRAAAATTVITKGDLAVSAYGLNEVDEYTASGLFVQKLMTSADGLGLPAGSAFDGNGNLYVTDFTNSQILKRDALSGAVSVLASNATLGGGHVFNSPESIVFNKGYTKMYVSDANRDGSGGGVNVVDVASGTSAGFYPLTSSVGSEGGTGESDWLAFDGNSNLYITNENPTQGVMRVDAASGDVVQPSFAPNLPNTGYALSFDKNGDLWVGDSTSILEYSAAGAPMRTITNPNFGTIFAAVFNASGDQFFAGDLSSGYVYTYDLSGNLIGSFQAGSGVSGLSVSGAAVPPNLPAGNGTKLADGAQEPIVAVNPTNPNNIVVGYNHIDSGGVHCGYSVSFDGGSTWKQGNLAIPSTKGVSASHGDPGLVFTKTGKLYFSCLAGYDDGSPQSGVALAIYSAVSSDGGKTFGVPALIVRGSKSVDKKGTVTSVVQPDQEQLAASPADGSVYMCYAEEVMTPGGPDHWAILLTRLDGAGLRVATGSVTAGDHEQTTLSCTVGVSATGRVWVGWWNTGTSSKAASTTTGSAEVAYSNDAATTKNSISFAGHTVLGPKEGKFSPGGATLMSGRHVWVRPSPIPGNSSVLAVWEDDTATHDLRTATYDGTSWTAPISLLHNIYQPTLTWGADGTAMVGFYQDSSSQHDFTSLLYTVARLSSNQLVPLRAVATDHSNAATGLNPFARFGDYTSVAEVGGITSAVWTDNAAGTQSVWFAH